MTARIGVLRPPRTVLNGAGTSEAIGRLARSRGTRVLLCTDSVLAAARPAELVKKTLAGSGVEVTVMDLAQSELPLETVESAIEFAGRAAPDCIVGLGGGTCLDLAKLVALGLASDQPLQSHYGEVQLTAELPPVIAVPTTAGTGSEVTPVAVLTDPDRELKVGISSPQLVPQAAICDPLLTHGAPPAVTAHAGIDALAHAIEAYCAVLRADWSQMAERVFVGRNSLSDRFALHAVELLAPALKGAMADEPQARADALEGSLCAGLAFATAGTALAHALQYPIGARTKTPHGLGVGLLLPYVMAFNSSACPDRLSAVAVALGAGESGLDGALFVARLAQDLGIPASLAELGVEEGDLEGIADQAMSIARLVDNNPRRPTSEQVRELLRFAHTGDLHGAFDRFAKQE